MKLTFFGGVETVTGSKFLIETDECKLLIDCGLFQGLKELRLRNWRGLPFKPEDLDGVILTHAHIDHSGYVPLIIKKGYRGNIYCTRPTKDLCDVLLPDCGRIAEEDARYANEKNFSKHHPALPLYTENDAKNALKRFVARDINQFHKIGDVEFRFTPVGHILGAASVTIRHKGKTILFSGDIGRYKDMLENSPEPNEGADFVVMESTYGDRLHDSTSAISALADLIKGVVANESILLIPTFALGRAQLLLYCLSKVFDKNLAPKIPVFLDSPMATQITNLYKTYPDWHRLSIEESEKVFSLPKLIGPTIESKRLAHKSGPIVLLSASGMITGGRILHHVKNFAPEKKNVILLPGYQAAGTRGASLVDGAKTLKIHGQQVPIRATVHHWDVLSAHADQKELLRWIDGLKKQPKQVFLVHGESSGLDSMAEILQEKHAYKVTVPKYKSEFQLG